MSTNGPSNNSSSARTFRVFAMLPPYPGLVTSRHIHEQLAADGFTNNLRTVQRDLKDVMAQPYIPVRKVCIGATPYYGRAT